MANDITGSCEIGASVELVPDAVDDILPPGYLDEGTLPLDTTDQDIGVDPANGVAITGECAPSSECPPGCSPSPTPDASMPTTIYCDFVESGTRRESSFATNEYLLVNGFWSVAVYKDTTVPIYLASGNPINKPIEEEEYTSRHAWLNGDFIYTLHLTGSSGTWNYFYQVVNFKTGALINDGFFFGGAGDRIFAELDKSVRIIVRGGIAVVGNGGRTSGTFGGPILVDLETMNMTILGFGYLYSSRGFCWIEGYDFLIVTRDDNARWFPAVIRGETPQLTELDYTAYTGAQAPVSMYDLENGHACILYDDGALIIDRVTLDVIKWITEGSVLLHFTVDYNVVNTLSVYRNTFILTSPTKTYKGVTSAGVADVFSLDTYEYLYTLHISIEDVRSQSYNSTSRTDNLVFRRRNEDNNSTGREGLMCISENTA